MNKELNKLKVGDKVYIKKYSLIGFEKILKVTKTLARSKNYNFDIKVWDNGYCRVKGGGKWNNITGHLATEELDAEWKELKICRWFDDCDFSKEDKMKIYNLFNPKNE